MKKKGYLLLEIILYMSIASGLIICVMNLYIFMSKVYKKELTYKREQTLMSNEFDLYLDGILKTYNVLDINISKNILDIKYEKKNKLISKDRFSIKKDEVYKRYYEYSLSGALVNVSEEIILVNNVKSLEFINKNSLIYVVMEFKDGEIKKFVYEK